MFWILEEGCKKLYSGQLNDFIENNHILKIERENYSFRYEKITLSDFKFNKNTPKSKNLTIRIKTAGFFLAKS